MKYLIVLLITLNPFLSTAQSTSDTAEKQLSEVYSLMVVETSYKGASSKGSIQIYYPSMSAPILQKNNDAISFKINLLNALNKHAEEGWLLVNVEEKDLEWLSNHSQNPDGWTDNSLVKCETIYLFKKAR